MKNIFLMKKPIFSKTSFFISVVIYLCVVSHTFGNVSQKETYFSNTKKQIISYTDTQVPPSYESVIPITGYEKQNSEKIIQDILVNDYGVKWEDLPGMCSRTIPDTIAETMVLINRYYQSELYHPQSIKDIKKRLDFIMSSIKYEKQYENAINELPKILKFIDDYDQLVASTYEIVKEKMKSKQHLKATREIEKKEERVKDKSQPAEEIKKEEKVITDKEGKGFLSSVKQFFKLLFVGLILFILYFLKNIGKGIGSGAPSKISTSTKQAKLHPKLPQTTPQTTQQTTQQTTPHQKVQNIRTTTRAPCPKCGYTRGSYLRICPDCLTRGCEHPGCLNSTRCPACNKYNVRRL